MNLPELLKRCLFGILVGLLPTMSFAEPQHSNIIVFPYAGAETKDQETAAAILLSKIQTLIEECQTGSDFEYLGLYKFTRNTGAIPTSGAEFVKVWRDALALELLYGMFSRSGNGAILTTNVFLGDFKGPLKKPSINITVRVAPEEFGSFRDEHGVIMLFALAMQAKQMSKPPHVVAAYLAKARMLTTDLGWLKRKDRIELVEAIDSELELLKRVTASK